MLFNTFYHTFCRFLTIQTTTYGQL